MNDEETEESVSIVALLDEIMVIQGLMQCLLFVLLGDEYKSHPSKQHLHLLYTVQEKMRYIELQLKRL